MLILTQKPVHCDRGLPPVAMCWFCLTVATPQDTTYLAGNNTHPTGTSRPFRPSSVADTTGTCTGDPSRDALQAQDRFAVQSWGGGEHARSDGTNPASTVGVRTNAAALCPKLHQRRRLHLSDRQRLRK